MSNPTARDAVHLYLSSLFGNAELAEGLANALDEAGFLITPGELDAIAKRQERERFEREIEYVIVPNNVADQFGLELPVGFQTGNAAGSGLGVAFQEGYTTYTRTSSPWKRTNPSTAEEA